VLHRVYDIGQGRHEVMQEMRCDYNAISWQHSV